MLIIERYLTKNENRKKKQLKGSERRRALTEASAAELNQGKITKMRARL